MSDLISNLQHEIARHLSKNNPMISHYMLEYGYVPLWVLVNTLVTRFISRAQADGAGSIRLLTNTLASWEFYEKRGFCIIWEKPFPDSSGERTMVYEYRGKER